MEGQYCDFLVQLQGHGLDHVVEKILVELDLSSLLSVELVSCNWRQVMIDLKIWTKILHFKINENKLWKKIHRRLFNQSSCDVHGESLRHKKMLLKISHATKVLEDNWRAGRYTLTLDDHFYKRLNARFYQIDDEHIVYPGRNGMVDRQTLVVIDRQTMQMKQEIDCALSTFHFVDDVIVTGASDGISVWNLDTAEQLNWIDSLDGHKIQDVRFCNGLLVAVSLPGGFHSSTDVDFLLSVWRMKAPTDITFLTEFHFRALHLHLEMDDQFIVALVSNSGDNTRHVHVWSAKTLKSVSTFPCHLGPWFTSGLSVHYANGLLVTAEPSGGIRIIDVTSGRCLRNIMTGPNRDGCLRFNEKYIVLMTAITDDNQQRCKQICIYDTQAALNTSTEDSALLLTSFHLPRWIHMFHLSDFQIIGSGIRMDTRPLLGFLVADFLDPRKL